MPRIPGTQGPNSGYSSIRDEVGVIVARTEDKVQRQVDPKTGKVLSEESVSE